MQAIHKRRLRKLAAFLRQVPKENWNYSTVLGNRKEGTSPTPKQAKRFVTKGEVAPCGTTACALGWMPAVFPKDWEWYGLGEPFVQRSGVNRSSFFGLSGDETDAIFFGGYLNDPNTGKRILRGDYNKTSTAKQVAERIETLIKWHEKHDAREKDACAHTLRGK